MKASALLTLGIAFSAAAVALDYVPPPLGRLVFNEVVDPRTTPAAVFPLCLPKTGRYYAELILEPPPGAQDIVLTAALAVDLDFVFRHRDRLLYEKSIHVDFAPGERVKTLFWIESPNALPDRARLEMATAFRATPIDQWQGVLLRLQITRKLEVPPIVPH